MQHSVFAAALTKQPCFVDLCLSQRVTVLSSLYYVQHPNRRITQRCAAHAYVTVRHMACLGFKPRERCRAFFEGRFAELDAELFSKHREAFPKDDFTLDAFLWAVATVRSRVHSPLDGEYVALVPLADLVRMLLPRRCTTSPSSITYMMHVSVDLATRLCTPVISQAGGP